MAPRFWVGGAGTWDTSDTSHWASVTNGASGASVPASADTVTFDASSGTGTITVNGNHSISSLTCSFGAGLTFDWSVNNNNLTVTGNFIINSASANTVKLGNGTFDVGGWVTQGASLTGVPGNATIVLRDPASGTSDKLYGGGFTPTYVIFGPLSAAGGISISSSQTLNNLTIVAPCKVKLSASVVLTITGTLTLVNTKGKTIEMRCIGSVVATLSKASGAIEFNWAAIRGLTFSGGASFSAKNSFDLGLNTGIAISPPRSGLILGG